ncbi:MAG TPA: hypothetical protein VKB54_06930 [Solirubrobacteraceae bacterium]|nr:hypothetical protein [Solirubrobacteraceae bacterium]
MSDQETTEPAEQPEAENEQADPAEAGLSDDELAAERRGEGEEEA